MKNIRRIIDVNPVSLLPESGLRRYAPRPIEMRSADYDARFDDTTIFYDTFVVAGRVHFCGPPLLNLLTQMNRANWSVAGKKVSPILSDLDRTQRSYLDIDLQSNRVIDFEVDDAKLQCHVSDSHQGLFSGRRVLMTLSKNNDLQWISDWANFYVKKHGIDAVLFYDNGSDRYTVDDVLAALDIPELRVVVVVKWNFKYGPQGGGVLPSGERIPWDSDFCQYSIFEHARYCFLNDAAGVVNQDIDELVITSDEGSIFDLLAKSETGCLSYFGSWVEVVDDSLQGVPRFSNFVYLDKDRSASPTKWAIDPRRNTAALQWRTHSIVGANADRKVSDGIKYRHFMGISSNWKRNRTQSKTYDPDRHRIDVDLAHNLADVFGADNICLMQDDRASFLWIRLTMQSIDKLLADSMSTGLIAGFRRTRYDAFSFDLRCVSGVEIIGEIVLKEDRIALRVITVDPNIWNRSRCSSLGWQEKGQGLVIERNLSFSHLDFNDAVTAQLGVAIETIPDLLRLSFRAGTVLGAMRALFGQRRR